MLKLTRKLFALQPDVQYAEFHERALFNHILGSMDPSDGATCYMVPVGKGVRREYAGHEPQLHVLRRHRHGEPRAARPRALLRSSVRTGCGSTSMRRPTAQWESAGATITMDSSFPEGDAATLTLDMQGAEGVHAVAAPAVVGRRRVCGARQRASDRASRRSPARTSRSRATWKTGDTVSLDAAEDAAPRAAARQSEARAPLLWGPLVLAGDLGPQPRRDADGDGDGPQTATMESPVLVTDRPVTEWLRPVAGQPGYFRTAGLAVDVTLAPFYRTHRRIYTGYWDLLTPAENTERLKELEAERERVRRLEAATIVGLSPTDPAIEKAHNQQGEASSIVRTDGRPGRRAAKWFSYDLPLTATAPAALVVTYNRDNRRARDFAVLVDGQRVGEEHFAFDSESRFFDREYALPPTLVSGKAKLTIRFEATGTTEVAPVYTLRLVRAGI